MVVKYDIEKFNGNNLSLWKLKMKAILRKDNCITAMKDRLEGISNEKWKKIYYNVIANLYLVMDDPVLSSVVENTTAK